MNIDRKTLMTYVYITIVCLVGIILIHFYYPFIHPYESHLLFASTSILIAVIISLFLKYQFNPDELRPILIFMGCYLVLMASNVFLSPAQTESFLTDVVHKEIVSNTRNRDTHNYYALVEISQYSLLGFNETARLRISKKAYEHLDPENYQAKVEVSKGFLKQPLIVGFNFHDRNKKSE